MAKKKPGKSVVKRVSKQPKSVSDKIILSPSKSKNAKNSLLFWAQKYFKEKVDGSPSGTIRAKKRDFTIFLNFYLKEIGHDHVDSWTPAVSKHFRTRQQKTRPQKGGNPYAATTVNRTLATLRHFARWLQKNRPLVCGDPFDNVKDIDVEPPAWNGWTDRQVVRLKSACEQRIKICSKETQNPLLEAAVFYTILNTGLRAFEISVLNVGQYHHRGLHKVKGKGNREDAKVPVPSEAREFIDRYLETRKKTKPSEPLFITRYGNRIATQDIARIFKRLSEQASAHLPKNQKFVVTPHGGRHTFLKKMADKYGIHFAQRVSRNRSVREVFRYAQPSDEEIMEKVENAM